MEFWLKNKSLIYLRDDVKNTADESSYKWSLLGDWLEFSPLQYRHKQWELIMMELTLKVFLTPWTWMKTKDVNDFFF